MLLLNFKAYFFKSLGCTVVIIHHDGSKTERNFVFNSVANMGRSVELRGGSAKFMFYNQRFYDSGENLVSLG